jgi:alpha-L-fucosidase 2
VWDLFTNYIEASEILGVDKAFRMKVAAMREKLMGPRIGRWGQLQEWMVDRDDPTDEHRHVSHMIAVHPGRQISPLTTPDLAQAARVSMEARGDGRTGWAKAWRTSIWARLFEDEKAYSFINRLVCSKMDNLYDKCGSKFQIDATFGYAAGVCEMLLQSHMGEVHFLPALPAAWSAGSIRGMRARGALEVDLKWRDGRATEAVLKAEVGGTYQLRAPEGQSIKGPDKVTLTAGETHRVLFD